MSLMKGEFVKIIFTKSVGVVKNIIMKININATLTFQLKQFTVRGG